MFPGRHNGSSLHDNKITLVEMKMDMGMVVVVLHHYMIKKMTFTTERKIIILNKASWLGIILLTGLLHSQQQTQNDIYFGCHASCSNSAHIQLINDIPLLMGLPIVL